MPKRLKTGELARSLWWRSTPNDTIPVVNKYEGLSEGKTKATSFHSIILFGFKFPSSKGSKFQAYIHIYVTMSLSKTQTGTGFLQTLLPLSSSH